MRGELGGWTPPSTNRQLALSLEYPVSPKHRPRREHDWEHIRQTLREELDRSEPRSVTEMAQALDVDGRDFDIQTPLIVQTKRLLTRLGLADLGVGQGRHGVARTG